MSGLEDELEQKGEQELKEKLDNELGGSSAGGQQGGDQQGGDQQGGDPNAAQDPNAGGGDQSQS
jgi:hypothetical protein